MTKSMINAPLGDNGLIGCLRHMALHDPDSSAAEKAIALKIGRQKKIQIIDGQQVTTKQQW